jgi:hypothetical protein
MQRHWLRCGPPTYRTAAHYFGLTQDPPDRRLGDPDALAAFLDAFPGASRR